MRVTVVHNISAGDEAHSATELVATLRAAGHDVAYASTSQDWLAAVQDPGDLVIAAGGDGTVARVARSLAGGVVPFAILPLGTANNFARTLGQCSSSRSQLDALFGWPARRADLGVARGPWGDQVFIEGAGFGLFADVLAADSARGHRSTPPAKDTLRQGCARLRAQLRHTTARNYDIGVDDDAFDTSALLVAVMNIRSIGPQLELATAATPFDGYLDVVVIDESDRTALDRYLAGLEAGNPGDLRLPTRRARRVTITVHDNTPVHVDDRSLFGRSGEHVVFEIMTTGVPVLVPPD